jgi:MtfA peptidase
MSDLSQAPAAAISAWPLLTLALATGLLVLWLLRDPLFSAWRRRRVQSVPFPAAWRQTLRRLPCVRAMPADLQLQLKKHIQVFVHEKAFIGCDGLEVTDEMRVSIAAQACLLILNRRTDYFANLRQILIYPGAFIVPHTQVAPGGVLQQRRRVLSGESWSLGQVILSWQDAQQGAAVPHDGQNVVIHEFAHQLDQAHGGANGAPRLDNRRQQARWAKVMSHEYAALRRRVHEGLPSLVSDYGATDPAEFFAVASEVFFEQPGRLAEEHPVMYGELRTYYRVDPLSW